MYILCDICVCTYILLYSSNTKPKEKECLVGVSCLKKIKNNFFRVGRETPTKHFFSLASLSTLWKLQPFKLLPVIWAVQYNWVKHSWKSKSQINAFKRKSFILLVIRPEFLMYIKKHTYKKAQQWNE